MDISIKLSPSVISSLREDEIFVFGSNLAGRHAGGSARTAFRRFGAQWGVGVGLQGQSYAIPTMHGGVEAIRPYVEQFIDFARSHRHLTFLVTRIGCGIAGFKDEEMAPLFKDAIWEENIHLPAEFARCILDAHSMKDGIGEERCEDCRDGIDPVALASDYSLRRAVEDKIRGSLIGGAVGDALGYPVEFVNSFEAIQRKYGPRGITSYDLNYSWLAHEGKVDTAQITDDTQMTLYTCEGIIEAVKHHRSLLDSIRQAYLAWLGPQIGQFIKHDYHSRLLSIPEFNQRRAPGNTCISALLSIHHGHAPANNSKGCGGVMRVAPIGIIGALRGWQLSDTAYFAGKVAEITHLHPMSTYSSAVMAVIVQRCIQTRREMTKSDFLAVIHEALQVAIALYGERAHYMTEFIDKINQAVMLHTRPLVDWDAIERHLGGGWIAEEALAIALFSVLRHFNDFSACMVSAVNHGGDSDSTGAIAGNILGAIIGYDRIPQEWKARLQHRDLLLEFSLRMLMV